MPPVPTAEPQPEATAVPTEFYFESEEQIIGYINAFADAEEKPEQLVLMLEKGLWEKLFADDGDGFVRVLLSTRIATPVDALYISDYCRVQIARPQYLAEERDIAGAEDWDGLTGALREKAEAKNARITLFAPAEMNLPAQADALLAEIRKCGVSSCNWTWTKGCLELYDIAYYPCFCFCETAEDAAAFIDSFADAEEIPETITLLFEEELWRQLSQDEHMGLYSLMHSTRLSWAREDQWQYADSLGVVVITSPEYLRTR